MEFPETFTPYKSTKVNVTETCGFSYVNLQFQLLKPTVIVSVTKSPTYANTRSTYQMSLI